MATDKKCVIIGPAFPLRGGIAQLNESLSQEFTQQGIENVIFSFYLQYPSFLFPGTSQVEAADRKGPEGVKILPTISSVNPISWWLTVRQIKRFSPDFVVVRFWLPFMGPCLGTICRWLKKALGVPVVGVLDNVVPHEKRPFDKTFTKYFLRHCDAFVGMSSTVINDLTKFDSNKPRKQLYHPVYDRFGEKVERSFARKHLGIPENARMILFFGIIRKYKGLKLLLKAISQLEDKEDLRLVIAGEFYEDRAIYTKLIDKLKLTQHVTVNAGFVDKFKVKYYFCAADMVAQPYLSATQSGVTQIAYHFETPMLVTNVGGLPEMVPHGKVGYVTEPTPEAVSEGISKFFKEERYAEFVENIKEEKKRFSWDYFASQIRSLAEQVG
ncbi:MAG: glycosyltransferase [Flavobacteriales bacterium]|nr:glycosyltransferase [Flavobacteriales bacterium]